MEKDINLKLYKQYLEGDKQAFELLYTKYKRKVQYFVFNIIKEEQKAEDITQEVFLDIIQNPMKQGYSFKYHIFLLAKSKALNYLNVQKRREEINEKYILEESEKAEKDVLEIITKEETKKEILESINTLDDKYKNAMFLAKIEELSYQEVAEILGESVQNIKNLIHRGKKELRKVLLKKGFKEMNKLSKILILLVCVSLTLSGIAYAAMKIYENINRKASLTPTFTGEIGNTDYNSIWVGTFNLAWNEIMERIVEGEVQFEGGNTELANELNKKTFTKEQISEEDYYIKVDKTTPKLKTQILQDIKNKFNINNSSLLDNLNFNPMTQDDFTIYTMLYKEFEFENPFDKLVSGKFGESEENVKYFGINDSTSEYVNPNVKILFYNNENDFAIKLRTKYKYKEEIILYRTNETKSFNEFYDEIEEKSNNYKGRTSLGKNDEVKIPYISIDTAINYDELCDKEIKGQRGLVLKAAMQNVKFNLHERGGNVTSEAVVMGSYNSIPMDEPAIYFNFDDTFILFMKEEDKNQPYLSLKVDNTDILQIDDSTLKNRTEKVKIEEQ